MPMKKRKGPEKRTSRDATPMEWAWLVAEPDCNGFLGFTTGQRGHATSRDRLVELWEEHRSEILEQWAKEGVPEAFPFGHPLLDEMPQRPREDPAARRRWIEKAAEK